MPAVTARAVSPDGEEQYLRASEDAAEASAEENDTEWKDNSGTGSAEQGDVSVPEGSGDSDTAVQDEGTAGGTVIGGTADDAPDEENAEDAAAGEADEDVPAGEAAEDAQAVEEGGSQSGETSDGAQADGTGESAQAGGTGTDALTDEALADGALTDGAQIGGAVEAVGTENAAGTAQPGDPVYKGEEDGIDGDTAGMPANLSWDGITGRWDEVKGAEKYKVELFRIEEDGSSVSIGTATPAVCEFTFYRIDLTVEGTYYYTVRSVVDGEQSEAAVSEEKEFRPIPAPENLRWDGMTARWDAVEGQTDYVLWLYRKTGTGDDDLKGVFRDTVSGGICEMDLTVPIGAEGDGEFSFAVQACEDAEKWYYSSDQYMRAYSPMAEFGDPDLILLPEPKAADMKFSIPESGHLIATWAAPTGLDSDVGYKYRVTLYKDDAPVRTVDCGRGTLRYDFTESGDAPTNSESELCFGVRYVPDEGETRYCAGTEVKMYSWNYVTPAEDLPRSLEGSRIDLVRAGATSFSFWPVWTGAYGNAYYILLKLSVTRKDGTAVEPRWASGVTRGNITGKGTGYNYSVDKDFFQEGDTVKWEAVLTDSPYHSADSISGTSYAKASGSFTIEKTRPHTVTLNANGMGRNSSIVVEDKAYLPQAKGYLDALPTADGYAVAAFSTLKKGIGEYTYNDRFTEPITKDMTLYAIWVPEIREIEVDISTPVCGTEVDDPGEYEDQANGPKIKVPMDAAYEGGAWNGLKWYEKQADGSLSVYSGKIRGGRMYYSYIMFQTDTFEMGPVFTKDVKLTGNFTTGTVTEIRPQYQYSLYVDTEVGVKAVHDWGEEVVIREATETTNGLLRHTCKGCGETEEEIIPRTGPTFIKVTTDGNGTATAGRDSAMAGKRITLTATPDEGYRFYKWEVVSGDIEISDNKFTIGTEDVEVKAVFGKIPGKSEKVTVYNVAQGIKVTWLKVPDATSYYIYRDNLDGKGYKFLFRTSALEVTDLEVRYELGKKFRYKVLATSKYGGDAEGFRTSTYYRLMPTGITSVKNSGAGKMTVTYDKSSGGSGYVVRYGLKKDMSDAKVITVKGENTTSRTFTNLKKGQTYYVQVRTYKIEDGIRYYSGYCLTKTVKIVK